MNSIRILNPTVHGALDYLAAIGLIALPLLLGFEGLQLWLSVAGGIGLIGYSLLTDYTFSLVPLVSFRTHLGFDLAAAAAFVIAPFALGWGGLVMGYYLVMAAGVIVVVVLTNRGTDSPFDASSTATL